jgi:aminopeptidase YwaD
VLRLLLLLLTCRAPDPGEELAALAARESDAATRFYLAARFRCLGLAHVHEQPFADTANVVATLPGDSGETIVVGAHHDHVAGVPGANDNASGLVALLQVAQQLPAQRHTVVFVAFGGEERGLLGSRHFVARLQAKPRFMVNLDMVGSYSARRRVYAFGHLPRRLLRHDRLRIVPGRAGRDSSDHQPFADLGVPYVFFWTPDPACYHAACDTAERVDLPHLADIAALTARLVTSL